MLKSLKRKLSMFVGIQLIIFMFTLVFNHKITLFNYINMSFYFSTILLLCYTLIFIIRTGFFDVVAKSFSALLTRRDENRKFSEIIPLSRLVTIDQKPLLQYGLATGAVMLIALLFYYV